MFGRRLTKATTSIYQKCSRTLGPNISPATQVHHGRCASSSIMQTTTTSGCPTNETSYNLPNPTGKIADLWKTLDLGKQELPSMSLGKEMLTDNFERTHTYLRISLTEKCNLRCTYCMSEDGVDLTPKQKLLTSEEIVRIARLFVHAGVTKIRLTGGEPLVRRDIEDICESLGALRSEGLKTLGMTTNAIALKKKLPRLHAAGLDKLNISLDTLDEQKFRDITRFNGYKKVREGIEAAIALGYTPKVNTVVMRGLNDMEVVDLVRLTEKQPIEVRFIEYMPFDGNRWSDSKLVPYRELIDMITAAYDGVPMERIEDAAGEVSKSFRVPGAMGRVGFISSMSDSFCSTCNRLRITADGNLKVCLFDSTTEVSLRDMMREGHTDEQLAHVISMAVKSKKEAHAGMHELAATGNRAMVTIGG